MESDGDEPTARKVLNSNNMNNNNSINMNNNGKPHDTNIPHMARTPLYVDAQCFIVGYFISS